MDICYSATMTRHERADNINAAVDNIGAVINNSVDLTGRSWYLTAKQAPPA